MRIAGAALATTIVFALGAAPAMAGNDVFVVDQTKAAVIRVDAGSGAQTIVSSGGALVAPTGGAVTAGGTIYVADQDAFGGTGGVLKVGCQPGGPAPGRPGGGLPGPARRPPRRPRAPLGAPAA